MIQVRKSIRFGPLRLTFTRRGVSVSVGAGPLRISRGADGRTRRTIRYAPGVFETKTINRRKR
jgi:hypothetical protein